MKILVWNLLLIPWWIIFSLELRESRYLNLFTRSRGVLTPSLDLCSGVTCGKNAYCKARVLSVACYCQSDFQGDPYSECFRFNCNGNKDWTLPEYWIFIITLHKNQISPRKWRLSSERNVLQQSVHRSLRRIVRNECWVHNSQSHRHLQMP